MLEELLSEQLAAERRPRHPSQHPRARNVAINVRCIDLAGNNAKQSYDQRFRVMKPNTKAIQEALQDALGLARAT